MQGVKPPLQYLEETQHCSLGSAGKEGLHCAMTGESHSFSRAAVGRLGFLSSYDGEHREPLMLS